MRPTILRSLCISLALTACALAGCGDKPGEAALEPGPAEPQPPAPEAPSAAAEPAVPAEPTEAEVPVAADFEDEAQSSITAANYKAELDAIEKELAELEGR